jgi:hypothetical protein
MTTGSGHEEIADVLRACATGIRHLEAGVSLLIDCGCWLRREDFTGRFVTTDASPGDRTLMASIDWEAATTALDMGQLPCSSGERRVLQLAASIAGGIPVSLSDTLTGIDTRNAALVTQAVAHAAGHQP